MVETLSPEKLSKLIGAIYDGVLDRSRWEQTFIDVKDALDSKTVIKLVLPHIRRAVKISSVLGVCAIERTWMTQMLDTVRCAALLTNQRGVILHSNRLAEQMLGEGQLIQSVRGVLQARLAGSELRAALVLAAKNGVGINSTELVIRLTESSLPPIFAYVLPLPGFNAPAEFQPSAVTGVFINAIPDEEEAAERMATAFGLTPAETRLLANLLAGKTIGEAAVARGTAVTTAKTHLDHIFAKTGVTRQANLMRLSARLVFTVWSFIGESCPQMLEMGLPEVI
jgi:DNA-binding CsgD family transcriptional regulator